MGTLLSDASPWAKWRPQHERGMKTIMLSFGLSSWQRPIFLLLFFFFLSFSLSLFLGLFGAIGAQTLRARTVPAGANEGLLQARAASPARRGPGRQPLKPAKSRLNHGVCAR